MSEVKVVSQKVDPVQPDAPRNCGECIYRHPDGEALRCRRHAPSPGRDEHEPTYWPIVSASDVCGLGSLGRNPKAQHVECETCMFWHYTKGGITPRYALSHSDEWWQGAGLCRLRAPGPSSDADQSPVFWRVVNFMTDGCGEGRTPDDVT